MFLEAKDQSQIYKELLKELSENLVILADKPHESAENTLQALWLACSGSPTPVHSVKNQTLPDLDDQGHQQLRRLIEKRLSGTPLGHLIGVEQFMELDFKVDQRALIPRKETEILGYAVLERIQMLANQQSNINLIDVCTGMGNLAIAFAFYQKKTNVWASDLSEEAIALARENANWFGLNNRLSFFSGDLLQPLKDKGLEHSVDVITCNPPYISTAKVEQMPREISDHEPKMAFNGGSIGLQVVFRLIKEAIPFLKPGGWLCFEVGLGQGPGLLTWMKKHNHFQRFETATNAKNEIRAILAQTKS